MDEIESIIGRVLAPFERQYDRKIIIKESRGLILGHAEWDIYIKKGFFSKELICKVNQDDNDWNKAKFTVNTRWIKNPGLSNEFRPFAEKIGEGINNLLRGMGYTNILGRVRLVT